MAEKYYLGEPALWDTSTVRRMKERVQVLKPLLIGKRIPNMFLTDPQGKLIQLHATGGNYTVMFLYDPDCSHCKEETPKLLAQNAYFKSKGIQVFAASIVRDMDLWKNLLRSLKFSHGSMGLIFIKIKNRARKNIIRTLEIRSMYIRLLSFIF